MHRVFLLIFEDNELSVGFLNIASNVEEVLEWC